MEQLGRFVITESIEFLHRNLEFLSSCCPSFSLALNLSAEELSSASLIDLLGALLRQYRIPDNMLSVELTEHTAVESFSTTNSTLDTLHAQGIAIAIDDFGTGFSSLSYLLELSADKIKIDRSFLSRYPDSESITIYKTVLLLAKEVGAVVLAEGVEDEHQLAFLSEIGCDEYQGYLFSPAVDEQAFLAQMQEVNHKA
jgi:EAL domain-containing protein (putative c-di-GMP-specific phosphodiesterase class I)